MYCKNCGNQISSGDRICKNCGLKQSAPLQTRIFDGQDEMLIESWDRQLSASKHGNIISVKNGEKTRMQSLDYEKLNSSLNNIQKDLNRVKQGIARGNAFVITAGVVILALIIVFGILGYRIMSHRINALEEKLAEYEQSLTNIQDDISKLNDGNTLPYYYPQTTEETNIRVEASSGEAGEPEDEDDQPDGHELSKTDLWDEGDNSEEKSADEGSGNDSDIYETSGDGDEPTDSVETQEGPSPTEPDYGEPNVGAHVNRSGE